MSAICRELEYCLMTVQRTYKLMKRKMVACGCLVTRASLKKKTFATARNSQLLLLMLLRVLS